MLIFCSLENILNFLDKNLTAYSLSRNFELSDPKRVIKMLQKVIWDFKAFIPRNYIYKKDPIT